MTQRSLLTGLGFVGLVALLALLVYLNLQVEDSVPVDDLVEETTAEGRPPAAEPSRSPRKYVAATPTPVAGAGLTAAPTPTPALTMRKIVLYFQGVDVGLLFTEERDVPFGADGNTQARSVIDELAKGPTKDLLPTMPPGTQLREVYFDSTGVAYVDFSAEFRNNHRGGSAEELMTIESVVNSLARNVPQVQAVRFLVEGRAIDTLAGHVDLASPLRPSSDRVALAP